MDDKLLEVNGKLLENLLKENKITDLAEFDKDFLVNYTYDAISLEGKNKMTFENVKKLIERKAVAGYSEREVKEVLNHVDAYYELIKLTKSQDELLEEDIKDLHAIIQKDIIVGGVYRNVNVQIPGATHQPPSYIKVYVRMKRMFDDLALNDFDFFDKGLFMHANLAKIHPFLDGNGRVGRLILNFYLIKSGHIPISIPLKYRKEYFDRLDHFKNEKEILPLKNFIKKLLNERYVELIEKLEV